MVVVVVDGKGRDVAREDRKGAHPAFSGSAALIMVFPEAIVDWLSLILGVEGASVMLG
jgi:hypothetical protein